MNLRDLHYVLALAEQKNFTRAAQVASVSQPALSNQIKKLEAELGHPIFIRTKGDVRLTPFGEKLIVHAHDVATSVAQINALAQQHRDNQTDTIRIGTTPTLASYLARYFRQLIADTCPETSLIISEAYPEALVDMVIDGAIDIAFVAQKSFDVIAPTRATPIRFTPLCEEQLFLAVRKDHALAGQNGIWAADVPADQLIKFDISFGFGLETQLPQPTGQGAASAGVDMQTARFESVCRNLAFCDACTLVNAVAAEQLQQSGFGLCFIPFHDRENRRVLGAVTLPQLPNNDVVEKLQTQFAANPPAGITASA